MSIFSRDFRIESKEFQVSIDEKGVIKLSEWSRRFVNSIHMGKFGAEWMVNVIGKLLQASPDDDFVSKFNESRRSLLAQRCSNKGGRYVTAIEYGERRKVGMVMVPEGRFAYGWQILHQVFKDAVSFLSTGNQVVVALGSSGIQSDFTYAKAVQGSVADKGGRGRVKEAVMVHADLEVQDTVVQKNLSNVHTGESSQEAMKADFSAVTLSELWKSILLLHDKLEGLAQMVESKSEGGQRDLKCKICGSFELGLSGPGGLLGGQNKEEEEVGIGSGPSEAGGGVASPSETVPDEVNSGQEVAVSGDISVSEKGGSHERPIISTEASMKLPGLALPLVIVPPTNISGTSLGGQEVESSTIPDLEQKNPSLEVVEVLGDNEKELMNVDPLAVCFPSDKMEGKSQEFGASDWVLDMVPSVSQLVGVSCEGHEEELMELFRALEKDRVQSSSNKSAKSGKKLVRELKGLNSSVNYGSSSSIARKSKSEGRALLLIK